MRRIIMAILATVVGTTLLIGLKAYGSPTDPALSAEAPLDPASPDTPGAANPSGQNAPPGSSIAAASAAPSGSAGTSPGPGPATTAPLPTTAAPPAAPASRTLTGSAVAASNFGNMQVSITVTGTHIDSIATVKQSNRPGSTASKLTPLALSAQAVPTAACKTTVSGATYSCEAWKQSLQSAIGQI